MRVIHNHAYVSIRDCVADFFGKGTFPRKVTDSFEVIQRSITDSNRAKYAYDKAIKCNPNVDPDNLVVILATQWRDDFEPNTSSKTN